MIEADGRGGASAPCRQHSSYGVKNVSTNSGVRAGSDSTNKWTNCLVSRRASVVDFCSGVFLYLII